MKIIYLAAGMGTRLSPLTQNKPKCMVPYQGRPLIDSLLDVARACPLSELIIVHGAHHHVLEEHLAGQSDIRFFHNPRFAETNMVYSLFCAEEALNDDIIISYSDILYSKTVLQRLMDAPGDVSVIVDKDWRALWEVRFADPLSDAETLKLDETGSIIELGQKTDRYADIEGQYIGLIKISKQSWPAIRDFYMRLQAHEANTALAEKMFMTDFIQLIINHLIPVKAVFINGGWLELDTLSDLDAYEKTGLTIY